MPCVQSKFYFVVSELSYVFYYPTNASAGASLPLCNSGVSFSFLQNYTQYIPLSIYDLQTWMGSPSIFVYDCSNAGLIVKSFKQFALQREQELEVRSQSIARVFVSVCAVGLNLSLFCYAQLKKIRLKLC